MQPLVTEQQAVNAMRKLAELREQRTINPHAFQQQIELFRSVCPEVVCPGCNGFAKSCTICASRGLVCPTCRGARWVGVYPAYQDEIDTTPAKARACPRCTVMSNEGRNVHHLVHEAHAIQAAYVEGASK